MPDERARFGADQGHARVARTGGGAVAGRGRRDRLQHVHRAREARPAVRRPPRPGAGPQSARPGEGDRGRRLLRGGTARAHLRALSGSGRGLRPRARSHTSRTGSARAAKALRAGGSPSGRSSRPTCRRGGSGAFRRGCRSRWAATRSAPTASSLRCAVGSRADGRATSSRRSPRSRATASARSRFSVRT